MSLVHALKWSVLSELASKAIAPVTFIILARLLTPEDFGVMTSALMVIGFSQIFWEAGMGKALIQRQMDIKEAANVAFWINIVLALMIALALYLVAEPVADYIFHDERVTDVLQVMTLQILLGAVSSVHTALLQKEMAFKRLFWVRFATVSLPGLASIPLAWYGMGYWALVAGTLVGQLAQAIILWRISHWRPDWSFHSRVAKELGRFGAWVGASGLLAWFFIWADAFIVGIYLGNHELGLYRTGNQFSQMAFALLFGPIIPVLYSHLSRMNQDKQRIRVAAEKVIKVLILIAVPVSMVAFAYSPQIETVIFGEKWQGVGLVIGVMALMHGFSWVVGMNGELYRSIGKPSYETIVTGATLVVYLIAYLVAIQYGFETFVWTRLGLAVAALFLHLFVLRNAIEMSVMKIASYLLQVCLISGLLVYVSHAFVDNNLFSEWVKLLLGGLFSSFVVVGTLYLFERNGMVREIMLLVRKKAG